MLGEVLRVYLESLAWVGDLMSAVPDSSFDRSTPCAGFDVRSLSGHLLGTAERSLGTAEHRSTREIPHVVTTVPDAMLAARFRELEHRIGVAWSMRPPGERVAAPWGQCSVVDAVRGFTIETLVHGWDLAVATGASRAKHPPALPTPWAPTTVWRSPKRPVPGCTTPPSPRPTMPDRPNGWRTVWGDAAAPDAPR